MEPLKINRITRSEDEKTLCIGTTYGFCVYSIENEIITKRFHRTFRKGIGLVTILNDTNIVAFVGEGSKPYSSPNELIIWDDLKNEEVMRKTFESPIKNIKLSQKYLIVAFVNEIAIMDINNQKWIEFETDNNPNGVFYYYPTTNDLFIPSQKTGEVKNIQFDSEEMITPIKCHKHPIDYLTVNHNKTFMSTFSTDGAMIRVWMAKSGIKIREFERGTNIVGMINMSFDLYHEYLLSLCNDYIISIFDLKQPAKAKSKWKSSGEPPVVTMKVESSTLVTFFIGKSKFCVIDENGNFQKYVVKEDQELMKVKIEKDGNDDSLFNYFI